MGPLSYMQSVVDRNVVTRRIPVFCHAHTHSFRGHFNERCVSSVSVFEPLIVYRVWISF